MPVTTTPADATRRDILLRCAGAEPSVSRLADVYCRLLLPEDEPKIVGWSEL
jgi:hypothetical protein